MKLRKSINHLRNQFNQTKIRIGTCIPQEVWSSWGFLYAQTLSASFSPLIMASAEAILEL